MPSNDIATLLKSDFDELACRNENDRFAERTIFKLTAKRRARLGVVAFAGGLGAAFAAAQFMPVVKMIAPYLGQAAPETYAAGMAPQLIVMLVMACTLAATAVVLRQDF